MKYTPIPVTSRTLNTKAEYRKMAVPMEDDPYVDKKYRHFCTGDRWITLGFLEGWLKNDNAPTALRRRSLAEAAELYAAQPIITENELLLGHLYLPEYTPEEQARYDRLCEMFQMSNLSLNRWGPRIDHLSLDLEKLLRVGVEGLISEIEEHKAALDLQDEDAYPGFDVLRKFDFYECCLIELRALTDLAARYAAEAYRRAETAEEPRRSELITMARIVERVPTKPARTFREAIQSIHFFLGTLFGLYPLNRPDRLFIDFYERDLQEGRIAREEAQELIDNFCLHVSTRVFSRAACGFMVGGRLPDGRTVENELTWMFLTALEHIRMPDPNGALAVTADTSDEILRYAADILAKGVTHPAFFNDDVITRSLIQYGCTSEDAANYIHTTCAEISVAGRSRCHTTSSTLDLPALLQKTAEELSGGADFEALQANYIKNIEAELSLRTFRYMMRMLEASRNGNEPMRTSCLVSDCLARGRSIYEGGERYSFLQPILVGFATAVDSLCAIRTLVFTQKELTLAAFLDIIKSNFAGEEPLRQWLVNKASHYGNDDPAADEMAKWLADSLRKLFRESKLLAGKIMMPGTFSYINHAALGAQAGASFDGRPKGFSYSDGCGPVQGRDIKGPTAMVLSLTSWDQSAYLGGMVVNMKFSPEHLKPGMSDSFIEILRAFMERGGIEMQVNVVDRQMLQDAYDHPENHGDILVRVGGYSDYFVRLKDELKLEIIARTEY